MGSQGSRCVAPPISERAGSEQMVLSAITAAPEIRWCVRVCLCVSGHETDSGGQRGHWGKFTSAWIIRAERMPEREHGGDTSSAEEARQEITKPSPNEKQTAVFFLCCFLSFCPARQQDRLWFHSEISDSSQREQFWLLLRFPPSTADGLCQLLFKGPYYERLLQHSKMSFCVTGLPNNAPSTKKNDNFTFPCDSAETSHFPWLSMKHVDLIITVTPCRLFFFSLFLYVGYLPLHESL